MYNKHKQTRTSLKVNESKIGEPIEAKLRRMKNNKEPVKDIVPMTYNDRAEGIDPMFNIKTDRFDLAIEAHDKLAGSRRAKAAGTGKVVKLEDKKTGEENAAGETSAKQE